MIKKSVTLERRLLPDVRLGNVSVQVLFPRGPGGLDSSKFMSDLETLVAQGQSGIRLVDRAPEYQIQCFTTAYQPPHITSKTTQPAKIFGSSGQPTVEREAHGNASIDARLLHVSDGTVLLAFTEALTLNASTSAGGNPNSFAIPTIHIPGMRGLSQGAQSSPATDPLPPTETDASLQARMIKTLALRVASHMAQLDEQITVLLAQGGALDEASRLALNSRWSEYLEKLSSVTPPADAADHAYLLYDLGVANEALGYAAGDPKAALKYLEESSINYSRAAEAKPAEKYFMEPQKRIETAITRYTKLAAGANTTITTRKDLSPAVAAHPATPAEHITNADVIKLVKAHLDKSLIANKIATAPAVDFDLSVDGLVALSQSGVSADLITLMTRRMQHPDSTQPE